MSNIAPKILIAAPISKHKDYCLWDWIEQVKGFKYHNYDVYLVDNSHDEQYHKKVWDKGIRCDYVSPKGKLSPVYITESQNKIRDYFLKGNYSHMLSLECDVFVDDNIIDYMLYEHKLVYAIPYFLYEEGREHGQINTALSFQKIDMNTPFKHKRMRKLSATESMYEFNGQKNFELLPALGCTLIHRSVISQIPFRVDIKANASAFSDSFFFYDCKLKGIEVTVDMSKIVEHRRLVHQWDMLFDSHKN